MLYKLGQMYLKMVHYTRLFYSVNINKNARMDYLTNWMCNPGLEHITGKIFEELDDKTLLKCRSVSKNWNMFIDLERKSVRKVIIKGIIISQGCDHPIHLRETIRGVNEFSKKIKRSRNDQKYRIYWIFLQFFRSHFGQRIIVDRNLSFALERGYAEIIECIFGVINGKFTQQRCNHKLNYIFKTNFIMKTIF